MTVDTTRIPIITHLYKGDHSNPGQGEVKACIMEAVAYIAREPWSDHPKCASKVIGAFLRSWNDDMSDEDRQQLIPLIPRLVGTAASPEVEMKRSYLALDWFCRVSAPAWLRLAGLTAEAEAIEATAPIVDSTTAAAAQQALDRGKAAGAAAGDAAWDAAWAAAWDAAWAAARAKLRPTVEMLQKSAVDLVERMIALQDVPSPAKRRTRKDKP